MDSDRTPFHLPTISRQAVVSCAIPQLPLRPQVFRLPFRKCLLYLAPEYALFEFLESFVSHLSFCAVEFVCQLTENLVGGWVA